MIRRNQEMRTERYEHLKGGDGCVELIHILNEDEMYGMGRFFGISRLPPGAGQRICSSSRVVQKTGNTYSIPSLFEPSAGGKAPAASSCRRNHRFPNGHGEMPKDALPVLMGAVEHHIVDCGDQE